VVPIFFKDFDFADVLIEELFDGNNEGFQGKLKIYDGKELEISI
jgi:hypothetical protein